MTLDNKLPQREIDRRVEYVSSLVEEIVAQRAEDRIGEVARVIIEQGREGRTEFQGPDVDGTTTVDSAVTYSVGDVVDVVITATDGADLVARPVADVVGE